eukprot:6212263-Pleurochrysis_carterae.AAC.6
MSPTETPATSSPCRRKSIRKACGPRRTPSTRRSASTTALSAVKPWEHLASKAVLSRNVVEERQEKWRGSAQREHKAKMRRRLAFRAAAV